MPSTSLQSRIKAFEALADQGPSPSSHTTPSSYAFSKAPQAKYPPPAGNILESPISLISDSFHPIVPLTPQSSLKRSPSPSPPNLGRKTSLIDLKDWIVDDGPNECPSAIPPHTHTGNGHLKGFRELTKTPPSIANKPVTARSTLISAPLINFESPPKSRPPLPPRKPSTDSSISSRSFSDSSATLRPPGPSGSLTVEHTYPPARPHAFGSVSTRHAPASSISSFHSVSLSSDGAEPKSQSPRLPTRSSPRTTGDDGSADGDVVSITDSFENVSVSSAISLTTVPFDWDKASGKIKPDLPKRPAVKPPLPPSISRSASTSSSSTVAARRPAPPPPASHQYLTRTKLPSSRTSPASTSASTSDRSSILSDATTTSRTSISTRNSGHKASLLLRPTPVPPAARARYEDLFVATVICRRKAEKAAKKAALKSPPPSPAKKSRQAAGWRGVSVDLITNAEDHPILSSKADDDADGDDDAEKNLVGPGERLSGRIVKLVWSTSKLDRQKLRDIWNDCNSSPTCSLDREAFIKGMWRIDEELRRAQLSRRMSALSVASSQRIPHRPKSASNSKLILQ